MLVVAVKFHKKFAAAANFIATKFPVTLVLWSVLHFLVTVDQEYIRERSNPVYCCINGVYRELRHNSVNEYHIEA